MSDSTWQDQVAQLEQEHKRELTCIRRDKHVLLAEMRTKNIKRMSFMNGGHSPESYRLNSKLFDLNTRIGKLKGLL